MSTNRRLRTYMPWGKNVLVWIISLITIAPLILIVINSLKDSAQASSMGMDLPTSLHFSNFKTVFEQGKLAGSLWNSVLYAGVSTILCVLLASMAAYVYARRKSRLNRFSYLFMLLGLAMPLNYFTLMKMMQLLHLVNSQLGIIILYAAVQIPLSVFILYGFVGGVPKELDEAGIIDGCGPIRLFFDIIFPLLKPAAVTVFILAFLNSWNEFLLPLYFLNSASQWPMTLSVYNFFGQFQMQWNLVSADIVLTSLPVVIVYLLGQRFIIAGMTAGSVKG
ncbi:carbohydrate ABC transporter membrane protein 2 (CUT1 family) [Paenibacillus cellulosilyticus]|uniref:Carbohydrate ABC transporter membrane protein 2 (CUT1 family) n=1 Tax=Paenibacillus cellulosilyticus TaxID=375489 RepID=A0A2V2YMQ1_9BACL|nr:carbohydrate ABC transporter permease [Paenibacillus cellulosilyticus]PWV95847.1 carbohydrate ABC transporter membrane protein 2 (CUT1 family) [Paenibacillus cellulosilyticus]